MLFKFNYSLIIPVLLCVISLSCSEDTLLITPSPPLNEDDIKVSEQPYDEKIERIQTVTEILRELYKDPEIVAEVNAAISTGYYNDEVVKLEDLIHFETSPVYEHSNFNGKTINGRSKFSKGKFADRFEKHLAKKGKSSRTALMPGRKEIILPSMVSQSIFRTH